MLLALWLVLSAPIAAAQPRSGSPNAVLQTVPVSAVRIEEGFWSARRKVNVEVSL